MDWLKSGLAAAQKQAQEAAEKAKAFAQVASQQAVVLAEQATEKAKVHEVPSISSHLLRMLPCNSLCASPVS